MRRAFVIVPGLILVLLAGCSLAEDITPPPALATQQAAMPQATAVRPQMTSQAADVTDVELDLVPSRGPDPSSGRLIYAESCSPCHGPEGLGDGEMAGNLEVPVPQLGDPAIADEAVPAEWYQVVTLGRMDRFMPPFRSLSDAQRWDVVAYALSLSTKQDQIQNGSELYQEGCVVCHGEEGRGGEYDIDITSPRSFSALSLDAIAAVIESGKGDMPAFGEIYNEADQLALAAYVRTLSYRGDVTQELALEQRQATDTEGSAGSLQVAVSNGTDGASVPEGLEVQIVAFDGDVQTVDQLVAIDDDGIAELGDLDIVPGRIFGAITEYQGVQYFSSAGHMLEEDPSLDLDLTIFETTPDIEPVLVDRLHVIFDFAVDGIVEVSELWLVSNSGDRTVVQSAGLNAMPIELPDGFSELRFGDELLASQVTPTEEGFVYNEPIRPGEQPEVIFTFTLPYERNLDFVQPIDYPVEAVVLLTEESAPELSGSGLNDQGTRPMGELVLHTYTIDSLEPGSTLALSFRGRHPAASASLSTTNLLIGAGVLVLTLAFVLFSWQTWMRRRADQDDTYGTEGSSTHVSGPTRAALLQAIAELDDAFEAGDIAQVDYEQQRAALKGQLIELMQEDDD
jgi:mono/diheme cytochrome c family protein